MFNSISWQEFFYAIAFVVGGYYIITTLLLYSGEINNIFKQKKRNLTNDETPRDQNRSNESNDLMGEVRYDAPQGLNVPREEQISSEEINPLPFMEPEEAIEVAKGTSPEEILALAVNEVKDGIKAIATSDPDCSKEDFITLLQALLSHYSQLRDSIHSADIHEFIMESCRNNFAFEIQPTEIISVWSSSDQDQ